MPKTQKSVPKPPGFNVAGLCRNFSELSPQPMVAVEGPTHVVRYLNLAFSRLTGKERTELIGRPFGEAIPERQENGCLSLLDRVYRTGTPEILEEQVHEQGEMAPVYWSYLVWAIRGADELPMGVMVQITDSTEIAVFRKQVVAINEQLLLSSTRQHELTEIAEKANILKDEFVATLSHELRTPLNVIMGWAALLGTSLLDTTGNSQLDQEMRLRSIDIIQRNAKMQSKLIDDLFDIQRIMTGKLRLDIRPVDLGQIVVAVVDGLRPASEAKGIDLQLQLESSIGLISADPERLQQVVWNLVSNAIKFTPAGGNVLIRLASAESSVEVAISDTGIGIAPEFLPHVFERFRQADATTTRVFGGLGLGLAIVHQLVDMHGGTVRVDSQGTGTGATFIVNLPLIAGDGEGHAQHPEAKDSLGVECPPEMKGLHMLVVDDEADMCEMLQIALESCGALVRTANSAAAAMEEFAGSEFDVLISDIGMPGEDGFSLIAQVHAYAIQQDARVPAAFALTAYTSEEDRLHVLNAGFQVHVPKPVRPEELVTTIANYLKSTR